MVTIYNYFISRLAYSIEKLLAKFMLNIWFIPCRIMNTHVIVILLAVSFGTAL